MKTALIGSCQMEGICSMLKDYIDIQRTIVVHKEQNYGSFLDKCNDYDLIISQPISDKFRDGEFATEKILKIYKGKFIMIPYVYFKGYFPELTYLYSDGKKIDKYGIVYHDMRMIRKILNCVDFTKIDDYDKPLSKSHDMATHLRYLVKDYHAELNKDACSESINVLEFRELNPYGYGKPVDVKISDYIRNNFYKTQLFHTMNHPSSKILIEMAHRILTKLGIKHKDLHCKDILLSTKFPSFVDKSCYIDHEKYTRVQFLQKYLEFYFHHVKLSTLLKLYIK